MRRDFDDAYIFFFLLRRTYLLLIFRFIFDCFKQLIQHIPRESLPKHLGGTVNVDHDKWLTYCLNYMTNSDKYGSSAMSDHICNLNNAKKDTGPDIKVRCFVRDWKRASLLLLSSSPSPPPNAYRRRYLR